MAGQVNYRLARDSVVREFQKGRLSRLDVCDAHPELVRAARGVGEATSEPCPICEDGNVVLVSYAFGAGLPPSGRCVTDQTELRRVTRRCLLRRRGVPRLPVEPPRAHVRVLGPAEARPGLNRRAW
jgi:Family of unknown function (DUF5318)